MDKEVIESCCCSVVVYYIVPKSIYNNNNNIIRGSWCVHCVCVCLMRSETKAAVAADYSQQPRWWRLHDYNIHIYIPNTLSWRGKYYNQKEIRKAYCSRGPFDFFEKCLTYVHTLKSQCILYRTPRYKWTLIIKRDKYIFYKLTDGWAERARRWFIIFSYPLLLRCTLGRYIR